MICYEFKGGIGTSSRQFGPRGRNYTIGVLVQANHGLRSQLMIAGVPVGREIRDNLIHKQETGSIIIVVATDAPALPHQLKRLARRTANRTGPQRQHLRQRLWRHLPRVLDVQSRSRGEPAENPKVEMLSNDDMSLHFEATVQATEEAIVNALIAAETMTGIDGYKVIGLPHDRLKQVLKKYNRLVER